MKILVTDGEHRSALAVTRSLGRNGHAIFVAGSEPISISACSKFCTKNIRTPNPLVSGEAYAERICEIVKNEKIDVIFPLTEPSIYRINRYRGRFPDGVVIACAPLEMMEAVSNKYLLFKLAHKLSVPIPETIFVESHEAFLSNEISIPSFPVAVKPAFSNIAINDHLFPCNVMIAKNRTELNKLYRSKPVLRYPSLIQEWICGEGTGLFSLFDSDRHLALFSHRRIIEKPPSGGVSVISESVALDPEMVASAKRLLSSVRWQGVAMVEFKRDIRDDKAKLMEINGRFWGSLQLAISSGIDFPSLCLEYYLHGKPISHSRDYKIRKRLNWFFGILDHLITRIKNANRILNLPPGSPSLSWVTIQLLKRRNENTSFDVYDPEDRKPFFREMKNYIRNTFCL
jgi:predicted ATP-grasp superfamily ATP-dependent carboligase